MKEEIALLPCQRKVIKEIFEKISNLGVRSNILLIGANGIGKSFLGRYLEKKDKFHYINLIEEKELEKLITYDNNGEKINTLDFIRMFIKRKINKKMKEKIKGIIIDNIDLILLAYKNNDNLKSFLMRFFRSENEMPIILISSLENGFIDKEKKEQKFIDFLNLKFERQVIHMKFQKEDSSFFTEEIIDNLPNSKYKNIYEIMIDKK